MNLSITSQLMIEFQKSIIEVFSLTNNLLKESKNVSKIILLNQTTDKISSIHFELTELTCITLQILKRACYFGLFFL
jgi:hypothetical protein